MALAVKTFNRETEISRIKETGKYLIENAEKILGESYGNSLESMTLTFRYDAGLSIPTLEVKKTHFIDIKPEEYAGPYWD